MAIFFDLTPIIIPIITIQATKTCFIIKRFLLIGHFIKDEIAIPEIINKIKPTQMNLIIEGKIFIETFPNSISLSAFAEITEAIVAPPKPKAKPTKCRKLNISSHAIFANSF